MHFNYEGLRIYYSKEGFGEDNVILLHGWGQSSETFRFLIDHLKENYQVFALDLPGFGKSCEPEKCFSVNDYVRLLKEFIRQENLNNAIIIGHSLGGRIGIKFAAQYKIKKLILIASAGIKPKRSLKYYFKVYKYKIFKKLHIMQKNAGSADYQKASPIMKGSLSLIVNEDLKKYAKLIDCDVLLIWGSDDQVTSVKDAYIFEKLISKADLTIIPGAGHFCYLDNKAYFLMLVNSFLLKEGEYDY